MTELSGIDPITGRMQTVTFGAGEAISAIAEGGDADCFLAPGLVDLQVNGYAGFDLNDGAVDAETVSKLARVMLEHGVTTFLPTVITETEDNICKALAAIAQAREADPVVREMVPGIHVEGPFISPIDGPRGAHKASAVRAPDIEEVRRWQGACGGLVSLITLSVHWLESDAFIAAARREGIAIAIGHTDATAEQIHGAAEAGAQLSTHLGNGAAATLPRHPNFIWAQLADDRLTATFIADGHHLPADTLKAMVRAKGLGRSILVSDVAALGGLKPGLYDQAIGGQVELTAEGRLGIAGTPYLAGAARNLNEGIVSTMALTGLPLADILPLATENPGRFADGRGRIEQGARADFFRFRIIPGQGALEVVDVWLDGEKVVG